MCSCESRHDLIALAQPKQAVIDEYAGELFGPIARCRRAASTDESTPPDKPEQYTSQLPTCARIRSTAVLDDVAGRIPDAPGIPRSRARSAAGFLTALQAVGDLGMKLHVRTGAAIRRPWLPRGALSLAAIDAEIREAASTTRSP